MKNQYGFTEFENIKEFEEWLSKQNVSRTINKLQVHHMYLPDYSCWKTDNALRRQYNTKTYHVNTNGWSDIAQHFSIFPDGHIVTGRSLNKSPAGITGWNTGAICCEIYGNFDKGHDSMNNEQKDAVIAFYALCSKKWNIPVNSNGIRPHAWFTAGGTYLGDYNSSKSAKTCPGTNFMGYGNTKTAFEKFYEDIKNYGKSSNTSTNNVTETKVNQTGSVNATSLNVRSGASTNYSVIGSLKNNAEVTIVAKCSNGWLKIKYNDGYGYVSDNYIDNIKNIQASNKEFKVKIICDTLNVRQGPNTEHKVVTQVHKNDIYTIIDTNGEWGKLKSGIGWICISNNYIERIDEEFISKEFKIKIICDALNVRSKAGTNYEAVTQVHKNEVYTIVQEDNGWGLLKSKVGWVNLSSSYVKKI